MVVLKMPSGLGRCMCSILLTFLTSKALCQHLSQEIHPFDGGSWSTSEVTFDWSVGGIMLGFGSSASSSLTEGPHSDFVLVKPLNIASTLEVLVYPNPVYDILTVSVSKPHVEHKLALYNMLGHLVHFTTLHYDSPQIDLQELASGPYILILEEGDTHFRHQFKIIKTH